LGMFLAAASAAELVEGPVGWGPEHLAAVLLAQAMLHACMHVEGRVAPAGAAAAMLACCHLAMLVREHGVLLLLVVVVM
jgi:hypothetical protein